MDKEGLFPNEVMQIHEMLNLKTISMTVSKLMEGGVIDQDLKKILEKDAQLSRKEIGELQNLLNDAPILGCEVNGND